MAALPPSWANMIRQVGDNDVHAALHAVIENPDAPYRAALFASRFAYWRFRFHMWRKKVTKAEARLVALVAYLLVHDLDVAAEHFYHALLRLAKDVYAKKKLQTHGTRFTISLSEHRAVITNIEYCIAYTQALVMVRQKKYWSRAQYRYAPIVTMGAGAR